MCITLYETGIKENWIKSRETTFTPPKEQSSGILISDRYCHDYNTETCRPEELKWGAFSIRRTNSSQKGAKP